MFLDNTFRTTVRPPVLEKTIPLSSTSNRFADLLFKDSWSLVWCIFTIFWLTEMRRVTPLVVFPSTIGEATFTRVFSFALTIAEGRTYLKGLLPEAFSQDQPFSCFAV